MVIGDLPSLVQNQISREFFLLRGNHECASINRMYGFCDEGRRRYNRLRKAFTLLCLQAAAIVDEKCVTLMGVDHQTFNLWSRFVHYMTNWWARARSPLGPLWAEPDDDPWAGVKDRGVSVAVGAEVVAEFPPKRDLDLLCRAHQVAEEGSDYFSERQLVTMFSAPNCCREFDHTDAMIRVDKTRMCFFQI